MEVDFRDDTPFEVVKPIGKSQRGETVTASAQEEPKLIRCLRNETIIVEFVPTEKGLVTDPKHILFGGLGESSKRKFVVPQFSSGEFKNVLTNSEKAYLENVMGLAPNALSIYRAEEVNYWVNRTVTLGKEPSFLNLNVPEDYIKYKILLANSDYISPSKEDLRNNRKATYQFVMSVDGQNEEDSVRSLNITSEAYTVFREIQDDLKKLAVVIENTTGRKASKIEKNSIWAMADAAIKEKPEKFIESAKDEYLDTKVLINDGIETGHIRKRQSYYYITETNAPLCTDTQEPTLMSACQFLNAPKNQETLLILQNKIYG